MSLTVKKMGWAAPSDLSSMPGTTVLPTTTGTTIVVVPESNDASTFAQNNTFGTGTGTDQIQIWEISADGLTASLRASFNSFPMEKPYNNFAADLYADNSIGIVYKRASDALVFKKVTYGTWTVGAEEVLAATQSSVDALAISINRTDVPMVGAVVRSSGSPRLVVKLWTRRTDTGVWTAGTTTNLLAGQAVMAQLTTFDISWSLGGAAASRPFVFAAGSAETAGEDYGVRLWTGIVNETTGAMGNITLRKTYVPGSMNTAKWGSVVRRTFIFSTGGAAAEFTLAHMESADKRNLLVARFTWDSTTFTEVIAPQPGVANDKKIDPTGRMSASYANDTINFYYSVPKGATGVLNIKNFVARIDRAFGTVSYSGPYWWDNAESDSTDRIYPAAGTGRNAYQAPRHVMTSVNKTTNTGLYTILFRDSEMAPAPFEVNPFQGQVLLTSTPGVSAKIRLGKKFGQSRYKIVWQFATDAAFTQSVRTFTQTDTQWVSADGTDGLRSFVYVADTLPVFLALSSGAWYVRAAVIDEFNVTGSWSASGQVTFSHPPSAGSLSPNTGGSVGDGTVNFNWIFSDPLEGDIQTALQVVVENAETAAVIYDSGKQTSASAAWSAPMPAGNTGIILRWKVRLWDSDNIAGEYSAYETFTMATPPSVVINTPAAGSTVTSGTPNILFTVGCATSRNIKAYQVTLVQGGVPVEASGSVPTAAANGTQLSWRPDSLILDNGTYTVQVTVTDNAGMQATSSVVSFTVNQVAPASAASVAATDGNYNLDSQGYVSVTWSDANRDTDFQAWLVERRSDEIDRLGVVVEAGTWTAIGTVVVISGTYSFRDYYAPSGLRVNYRVRQLVNRNGDRAISTADTIAVVLPKSDGYWIIDPTSETGNPYSFRLSNVTADSYTVEYESNEYIVAGRGRHVDKGDRLGVKGSLTAKLRDTTASTARQKKRELEKRALDNQAVGYIRTPFGDVWPVSIGTMTISRIEGVGLSEYCDIDLPYAEVGP